MELREVADRLGVHYQTVYRAVRAGELVAVRVGRRFDVSEEAFQRYVRARDVAETKASPDMLARGTTDLDDLRLIAAASRFSAQACFDEAVKLVVRAGGDAVALHTLSDDGTVLETAAAAVRPLPQKGALVPDLVNSSVDAGASPWREVLARGELMHNTDVDGAIVDALRERWRMPNLPAPRSHTLAPIVSFGRVVAILGVAVMSDEGSTDDIVERVQAVAETCALAIEVSARFTAAFDAVEQLAARLADTGGEVDDNIRDLDLGHVVGHALPAAVFDPRAGLLATTRPFTEATLADESVVEDVSDLVREVLQTGEDLHQGELPGAPHCPVIVRVVRGPDDRPTGAAVAWAPPTSS